MPVLLKRLFSSLCLITSLYLPCALFAADQPVAAPNKSATGITQWRAAAKQGQYDLAVQLANENNADSALSRLLDMARTKQLANDPQWRAFIHYKPAAGQRWLSQVDSAQFFLSDNGKQSPESELDATLAAFYSDKPKPPLRLTAYCRFVARRQWLESQLGNVAELIPNQPCPEFERYEQFLDAAVLTLIFPTAHPNSPSSAFGHTLLRIDKQDQQADSKLLNMSINFAAEIPEGVSSAAYALQGLRGGFPGKFRLLPYHMKLREYGQIENRDTWEYELKLDKPAVDLVLRHAYEMLISHYDYYFFTENCSYHLLSLLEVANPTESLTDEFGLWTIPVDTIRLLEERGIATEAHFVPSSIRTLQARRDLLPVKDSELALEALEHGLPEIDNQLSQLSRTRQAGVLDLLSDYERYDRLKSDPSAQGSSKRERAILSRRSKLGIKSTAPQVSAPTSPPDAGHGTSRLGLQYHYSDSASNSVEIQFRPAYHDFRDPSEAYDDKAAITMGLAGIAYDTDTRKAYLRKFTLISIESIEPRRQFFKPVSWHTKLDWWREHSEARHEFTFNVGAGVAYQYNLSTPVVFLFGESDLIDAPAFRQRNQLRLGASAGVHWEPVSGFRTGLELGYRSQIGGDYTSSNAELWAGIAVTPQWSINVDTSLRKSSNQSRELRASAGVRTYF